MENKTVSMSPNSEPEQAILMTWADAQAALLEGKKLTRVAWENDDQIFLFANALHLRKGDGSLHVLMVTSGDMTADDWITAPFFAKADLCQCSGLRGE